MEVSVDVDKLSVRPSDEDSRYKVWERVANELWQQRQLKQNQTPPLQETAAAAPNISGCAKNSAQVSAGEESDSLNAIHRSAHSCELEAWCMRHNPAWQEVSVPWVRTDSKETEAQAEVAQKTSSGRGCSQFRGVYRHSSGSCWQAKLGSTFIGTFDDEIDAAQAYDKVAIEKYGASKAQLNFASGSVGKKRKQRQHEKQNNKRKVSSEEHVGTNSPKLNQKPVGFRILKFWSELQPSCQRLQTTELTAEAKSVLAKKSKENAGGPKLKWQVRRSKVCSTSMPHTVCSHRCGGEAGSYISREDWRRSCAGSIE